MREKKQRNPIKNSVSLKQGESPNTLDEKWMSKKTNFTKEKKDAALVVLEQMYLIVSNFFQETFCWIWLFY